MVATAIKKAEDDNALIARFYEWAGKESDVKLRLPAGAWNASLTNLMEKPLAEIPVQGGIATVHTKPFEIMTVSVHFASLAASQSQRSHP